MVGASSASLCRRARRVEEEADFSVRRVEDVSGRQWDAREEEEMTAMAATRRIEDVGDPGSSTECLG